jgi:hypothetical protein
MNVSLVYSNVYDSYDLTESDISQMRQEMLDYIEPTLISLYEKYSSGMRTPDIPNKILVDLKKAFFKGMIDSKLVLRLPRAERIDLGSILNHCRLKIDKQEVLLTDYILYLTLIKMNKAFIQIR